MTCPCCERNARLETSGEYDDRTGDSLSGDVAVASRDIMIERCREAVHGIRAAQNTNRRFDLRAVSGGGMAAEHPRPVASDLQRQSDLRVALEDASVDAAILMREASAVSSRIVSPGLMRNLDWAREAVGLEPFVWQREAVVLPMPVPAPIPVEQLEAAE